MVYQLGSALLDAFVLAIVSKGDAYGYQISQEIKTVVNLKESTLYPVLKSCLLYTSILSSIPCQSTAVKKSPVKMPCFGLRGFCFNSPRSAGSIPMARAGRLSVSRLMNNRWTGANGTGSAIRKVNSTHKMPAVLSLIHI